MAQQLPLQPSTANYQFGTSLDAVAYIIRIRWNDRESAWYMDLLDESETPIRNGIKLVLGTLLGGRSAVANFPPGSFMLTDLADSGTDPTYDDMGVRVVLWYITQAELDSVTETGTAGALGTGGIVIPEFPGGS